MTDNKVIIVTVTFNEADNLAGFFDSVRSQTYDNLEVILCDNNSSDHSPEIAKKLYPKVNIIQNDSNLGFSVAVNKAFMFAKKLGADFVFLLNNDIKFNSDCIKHLYDLSVKTQSVLVGPILLEWDSKTDDIIQEYGGEIDLNNGSKKKHFVGEPFSSSAIPDELQVSFIGGGVSFINVKLLDNKKYIFDPAYFLYTEEMDLNTEIKISNQPMYVTKKAIVWHKVHGRSSGQKFREVFYITRNKYLYLNKFWGYRKALLFFFEQLLHFPRFVFRYSKQKNFIMILTIFLANIYGVFLIKGKINIGYLYKK